MAPARPDLSQLEPREDAPTFGMLAEQAELQNGNASPAFNPVTPTSSQSPYTSIKSEPTVPDYGNTVHGWQTHASDLTKLPGSVDFSNSYDMSAQFPHDVSSAAYPTPNSSITQKKMTSIGNVLPAAYTSAGMMLEPPALAAQQHSGELSNAFGDPISCAMPPTSSFSEFPTAATTPRGEHNSTGSSPLASYRNVLGTTHMSSESMMPAPVLNSLSDIPPASAGMIAPISRPMNMLAGNPVIDPSMSLSHQLQPSTAMHATGMGNVDNVENGLSSADSSGYGFATQPPSSGVRSESALFPTLLHSICEDPMLNDIARWDENNYVCIPSMENLRVQLNSRGMTANHTDSLQKNFNDYQFKRQTDQRRIRHTSEQGIVKFSNENFMPGRPDLLSLVVRKSALKKLQNGGSRERPNGAAPARKKPRVPSARQSAPRSHRQSTSERLAPYARQPLAEPSQMSGFPLPVSPSHSFQMQHSHNSSAMPQFYTTSETPGLVMPPQLGVANLGFNIANPIPASEQPESGLISTSNGGYSQQTFYMNNASPGFMSNFMQAPPHVSLPASLHGQYAPPMPPSQQTPHTLPPLLPPQQHAYQEHSSYNGEDNYQGHNPLPLHPPHMQQPHQYQLFASSGDMHSQHTPPRGINGGSHPA